MLKKLILKLSHFETRAAKSSFWVWLDRRERIKKLGRELEQVNLSVETDYKKAVIVSYGDFKEIYRIAKTQQQILTKNGKNL